MRLECKLRNVILPAYLIFFTSLLAVLTPLPYFCIQLLVSMILNSSLSREINLTFSRNSYALFSCNIVIFRDVR